MMSNINTRIYNKEQMQRLACKIADQLVVGDILCLNGDIGSGKTTFAQYVICRLLKNEMIENITSPTFNLVHKYDAELFTIWHFDLYRINNIKEFYNLGFEDAMTFGISIVEWPNIIKQILPKAALSINIDFIDDHNKRKITLLK